MKAILEFSLPEEQEEFESATNGSKYKWQLDDVWNNVFRPYHKHGYSDEELNKLLENEDCLKVFEKLEEIYRKTVNENEL